MMSSGELLTRVTIWIAVAAYTIGCVVFALARGRIELDRWVRLAWTVGCAALLAHFASAFHFYHAWSHESAYLDTARQTNEVLGINWGGGVFVNYAVAILWISDVASWWFAGVGSYRRRPWWLTLIWHGFLVFILFNGTFVFAHGSGRWIGLILCLVLCLSWVFVIRQRSLSSA
jgi:hypothetical protein